MVQPSTFSRHYQPAADLAAGSHKMSRWGRTLWEFYAQSAALCSTLSEVKRCWAVGLGGRCCNTRAGALMGTSVWDLLRGTLIKHDLLKPGWIINSFLVDARQPPLCHILIMLGPMRRFGNTCFSFCILLSVRTPPLLLQSSLVLPRKADFAEAYVFWIPWIPIQAAGISNLALILHSWSCTKPSLRRRLCKVSTHSRYEQYYISQ